MIYKFILTFLLNKLVDVHPPSVIWGSGSSDWLPVERGWGDLTTGRGENMGHLSQIFDCFAKLSICRNMMKWWHMTKYDEHMMIFLSDFQRLFENLWGLLLRHKFRLDDVFQWVA